MGWKNRSTSCQNARRVPIVISPLRIQKPPATKSAALVAARVKPTAGKNMDIARIWPRFAFSRSVFRSSNCWNDARSRVNSCTIAIPERFSFR